jgi:predicted Mrr-cat superfamily restriction endonuclease
MGGRAWAIKLGSGGRCVDFCERHKIVGLGWRDVDAGFLASASRAELLRHVTEVCTWYESGAQRSAATGQLYRFARECSIGDYVLYYDPPRKRVVVTEVTSDVKRRDFEPSDPADVWFYRDAKVVHTIPILSFFGGLKGRLLGPRMSFWELRPFKEVESVAKGEQPGANDPDIAAAYTKLTQLVVERAKALDARDWEWLVADWFRAQGAHVDERKVGGNQPIIDVEAVFDHGELGEELWRAQVRMYRDTPVDWPMIETTLDKVEDARLCFVSVYGFTDEATTRAEERGVLLREAVDFAPFLLSGRFRPELQRKIRLRTVR